MKVRNDTPRFGQSDEPPIPLEVEQMNAGTTGNPAEDADHTDDGKIHVVPAAVGTVAPLVNFPNSCDAKLLGPEFRTVTAAEITATPAKEALLRVRFPKELFEKVWAGEASVNTWVEAFPELATDADCNVPIIRVVRFDESGTSFAFKDELNALNPGRGLADDLLVRQPWADPELAQRGELRATGRLPESQRSVCQWPWRRQQRSELGRPRSADQWLCRTAMARWLPN